MNKKMQRALITALVLWLAVVGCGLPFGPTTSSQATLSPKDMAATIVAATVKAIARRTPSVTPTISATVTRSTSSPTVTPSITPTLPPTLTPLAVCPGPPVIGTFSASPTTITVGGTSVLSWSDITNATSIMIDQGLGNVAAVGSRAVNPAATTTYTMTTTGCGGTVTDQVSVIVNPAAGTCKTGYVYRLATPSDKVCVPPVSQAQAAADNAATASRKAVNVYGVDACIVGYVWREAFPGDKVCVTSAVRSETLADNAVAASRWPAGAYGAHTCIAGFVWREAQPGDDVCVTGADRDQAAADNAAASSRKAGPDTCISGYVWREAFSGDRVCVTPTVKAQVVADNAAAPSHTW